MENIRKDVQEHIYSLMAKPGEFISERQIAQKFELKRNNVREILLSMEGEGILERLPQRGYRPVNYHETDRQTVTTVRYALEHEAVRKGIENATREDMIRLAMLIEDMDKYAETGDYVNFCQTDLEFHTALINSSHDNLLIKMFSFMASTVFGIHKNNDHLNKGAQVSHREIFENFKKRDWPNTEKALRYHLGRNLSL